MAFILLYTFLKLKTTLNYNRSRFLFEDINETETDCYVLYKIQGKNKTKIFVKILHYVYFLGNFSGHFIKLSYTIIYQYIKSYF